MGILFCIIDDTVAYEVNKPYIIYIPAPPKGCLLEVFEYIKKNH